MQNRELYMLQKLILENDDTLSYKINLLLEITFAKGELSIINDISERELGYLLTCPEENEINIEYPINIVDNESKLNDFIKYIIRKYSIYYNGWDVVNDNTKSEIKRIIKDYITINGNIGVHNEHNEHYYFRVRTLEEKMHNIDNNYNICITAFSNKIIIYRRISNKIKML